MEGCGQESRNAGPSEAGRGTEWVLLRGRWREEVLPGFGLLGSRTVRKCISVVKGPQVTVMLPWPGGTHTGRPCSQRRRVLAALPSKEEHPFHHQGQPFRGLQPRDPAKWMDFAQLASCLCLAWRWRQEVGAVGGPLKWPPPPPTSPAAHLAGGYK